jgi:tRNA A-37 threonylcarbamoyl transferase component Bud32
VGLWEIMKQALGLAPDPARPAQAAAQQTHAAAQRAVASAVPGWPGPATLDPEAAQAALQAMARVTEAGFDEATWGDPALQAALALLEARGALEDLVEVLRRAALRLPAHTPLWLLMARIYTLVHDDESAQNIWQRLLERGQHEVEANYRLGELAERAQRPQEAAVYYQRVLALDLGWPNAWQRAEQLKVHLPMPRRRAAATVGGAQGDAQGGALALRAPEGYSLRHPLGRGGYGTVYLASEVALRREVAIKFLHPHLTRDQRRVEAFFEEARLVARLSLPGVVRIYDLDPAQRVIVMEYLTRGTLRDRLSSGRALWPMAAARVLDGLLGTLVRLHEAGVVHRDLKPENILFRSDGGAVLGDFGVAALEQGAAAGALAGTVAYMAPEQKARQPVDRRADLYAVGLILVEMLAGGLPAGAAAQVHAPEVFLGMLPLDLQGLLGPLLGSWLAEDPARRPRGAQEARDALRALRPRLRQRAAPPPRAQAPRHSAETL